MWILGSLVVYVSCRRAALPKIGLLSSNQSILPVSTLIGRHQDGLIHCLLVSVVRVLIGCNKTRGQSALLQWMECRHNARLSIGLLPTGTQGAEHTRPFPTVRAPNPVVGSSGIVAGGWSCDMSVTNSSVFHDDDEESGTAVTAEKPTAGASTTVVGDIYVIRPLLRDFDAVPESIVESGTFGRFR